MRSCTDSYKPSGLMPERLALRCASAVLLALLPLPHASAQGVRSINMESMDIESALQQVQQERVKQQTTSQEVQKPQTEQMPLPQQQVQQQKPSPDLQKPQVLAPMELSQTQVQKAEEKTKQIQQLTLEQQKQLILTQQKLKQTQQQELNPSKPQQMTEKIRETEKSIPEQPQQLVQTQPGSMPQAMPANPATIVQEKYQKLLDAGVFSASSGTPTNLDATMTRAQFAAIAAKLQELVTKSGGQFSDIDPVSWAALTSAMTAKSLTGIGSGSIKVESDDKKSSADFAALLAAVMKGQVSQAELDQLISKLGASNPTTSQVSTSSKNDEAIRKANSTVEGIATPPGSAAVAAGIAGVSAGSLATIGTALAAAAAASIAALSSANNIALASALTVGADYSNVTPRTNWPTNLNATYSGRLSGMLSDNSAVGGNLTMNVNFATIGSHASIPGSVQFDNNKGNASLSLVQLGGYVGGGMTGTYDSQAMTGFIRNGQFYGPAANAIKGSWDMTTNSVSGGGTFAATR